MTNHFAQILDLRDCSQLVSMPGMLVVVKVQRGKPSFYSAHLSLGLCTMHNVYIGKTKCDISCGKTPGQESVLRWLNSVQTEQYWPEKGQPMLWGEKTTFASAFLF